MWPNTQQLKFFETNFPNVKINIFYASTETGQQMGHRCGELRRNSPPSFYHPSLSTHFFEIVGEDGDVLKEGETGEIVITDLRNNACPLIRYKTGDIASIKQQKCDECGSSYLMRLGGRASYDVLRFHGVTLYTELIDRALSELTNFLDPLFQVHVYEEIEDNKIMPLLKLKLKLREGNKETGFNRSMIEETVTENLFLSADKALDYFVENKIFKPLEIEFVENWPNESKAKNIVSHLE